MADKPYNIDYQSIATEYGLDVCNASTDTKGNLMFELRIARLTPSPGFRTFCPASWGKFGSVVMHFRNVCADVCREFTKYGEVIDTQ